MKKRRKCSRLLQIGGFLLTVTMLIGLCPPGIQIRNASVTVPKVKAAENIGNPRIVDDSSMDAGQKVTWDCIWFGSYPQSEVTKEDSVYDTLKSATGWDSNNDITINGTKYRRLKGEDATVCGIDELGEYGWNEDYTTYHYFKYEPIKWRVLSVDGKDAVLFSDIILDDQRYNVEHADITWEESSVRSWLNGYESQKNISGMDYTSKNFIDSAFSQAEKDSIKTSSVINDDNIEYGTYGGNTTYDKVFLLSESETYNTDTSTKYGFNKEGNEVDEARASQCSAYASAMGAYKYYEGDEETKYTGNSTWILRSPGYYNFYMARVYDNGCIDSGNEDDGFPDNINYVDNAYGGIRPALLLDLTASESYSCAGTVCSDGSSEEVKNKQNHLGKDNFSKSKIVKITEMETDGSGKKSTRKIK